MRIESAPNAAFSFFVAAALSLAAANAQDATSPFQVVATPNTQRYFDKLPVCRFGVFAK